MEHTMSLQLPYQIYNSTSINIQCTEQHIVLPCNARLLPAFCTHWMVHTHQHINCTHFHVPRLPRLADDPLRQSQEIIMQLLKWQHILHQVYSFTWHLQLFSFKDNIKCSKPTYIKLSSFSHIHEPWKKSIKYQILKKQDETYSGKG